MSSFYFQNCKTNYTKKSKHCFQFKCKFPKKYDQLWVDSTSPEYKEMEQIWASRAGKQPVDAGFLRVSNRMLN